MTPNHEPDAMQEQPSSYAPPPETQRLIDELYREELREARAMAPEEKVRAGQQLFEGACRVTLAGIRNQNPGASEEQCLAILRQRLVYQRRLEEVRLVKASTLTILRAGFGARAAVRNHS